MKRLALFTAIFGFALSAVAQTPAAAPVDAAAPQETSAAAKDADILETQAAKDELNDRNCLKHTGSRVIRADRSGRKCANAAGHAYTKEDLDRTGETNIADALRKLDPTIR